MESAGSNIVFRYFVLPYTRNIWWGKFGKFTPYKLFINASFTIEFGSFLNLGESA